MRAGNRKIFQVEDAMYHTIDFARGIFVKAISNVSDEIDEDGNAHEVLVNVSVSNDKMFVTVSPEES